MIVLPMLVAMLTCSTSWLDHIISSSQKLIINKTIMYHTFYDHIPLLCDVIVPIMEVNHEGDNFPESNYIVWDKLQARELLIFQQSLDACFDHFIPFFNLFNFENYGIELKKIFEN